MLNANRGMRRYSALAVRIQEAGGGGACVLVVDPTASADSRMDLAAAWQSLAAADQEVLALHIWEELSTKDAAGVLGYTRAAYAIRLTRARRRLAGLLTTSTAASPALLTTH
jgi:RNA polymerase sigma-70 factor (ECF subfamily)